MILPGFSKAASNCATGTLLVTRFDPVPGVHLAQVHRHGLGRALDGLDASLEPPLDVYQRTLVEGDRTGRRCVALALDEAECHFMLERKQLRQLPGLDHGSNRVLEQHAAFEELVYRKATHAVGALKHPPRRSGASRGGSGTRPRST